MGSSIRLAHFCCTTLISPCAASTAAGSLAMFEKMSCFPNLSTASGSFTTYCAFFAIVALYHSTAGGRTRVFATSSAFVAMPVARATYCDISNTSTWSGPRAFRVIGRGGFARTDVGATSGAGRFGRFRPSRDSPNTPLPEPSLSNVTRCVEKKKRLARSRLHSNPACHAHTHTLTFKMVKMVESAEEFKALKMGDKPVRALPGSAPRFEHADARGTKRSRTCLFSTRARVFRRARRDRGLSRHAGVGIARSEPPRARVSPGRLRPRAPAFPIAPTRSTPPDRESDCGLNEHLPSPPPEKSFFSLRLRLLFVAPTADAPDPPLASFRHLSTHTSFWWTSPRLGAARAR